MSPTLYNILSDELSKLIQSFSVNKQTIIRIIQDLGLFPALMNRGFDIIPDNMEPYRFGSNPSFLSSTIKTWQDLLRLNSEKKGLGISGADLADNIALEYVLKAQPKELKKLIGVDGNSCEYLIFLGSLEIKPGPIFEDETLSVLHNHDGSWVRMDLKECPLEDPECHILQVMYNPPVQDLLQLLAR